MVSGQAPSACRVARAAGLCGDDDQRSPRSGARRKPVASLMRIAVLLGCVALGACGGGKTQPQAVAGAKSIECALGEGSAFGADCLVERVQGEQGPEFVVRHPDGKFRR